MNNQIDLANSKFVGFTEERLLVRLDILNTLITDPNALDDEIAESALLRKEVKQLLAMFKSCQDLGLDTSGMSAADIIEQTTGQSILSLQKQTTGGVLAVSLADKAKSATETTKKTVKKGAGGLGAWLSKWATGE
jgi:hypothetical protein